MSWSTDFDKLPKEGRVIVQGVGKRSPNIIDVADAIRITPKCWVAWHPEPEPYAPPKPEQITKENGCWNLRREEIIAIIEQRTREIVAWDQVWLLPTEGKIDKIK